MANANTIDATEQTFQERRQQERLQFLQNLDARHRQEEWERTEHEKDIAAARQNYELQTLADQRAAARDLRADQHAARREDMMNDIALADQEDAMQPETESAIPRNRTRLLAEQRAEAERGQGEKSEAVKRDQQLAVKGMQKLWSNMHMTVENTLLAAPILWGFPIMLYIFRLGGGNLMGGVVNVTTPSFARSPGMTENVDVPLVPPLEGGEFIYRTAVNLAMALVIVGVSIALLLFIMVIVDPQGFGKDLLGSTFIQNAFPVKTTPSVGP